MTRSNLFEDTFKSAYNGQKVIIEYIRDVSDKITALKINTDWIKNLRFEKK